MSYQPNVNAEWQREQRERRRRDEERWEYERRESERRMYEEQVRRQDRMYAERVRQQEEMRRRMDQARMKRPRPTGGSVVGDAIGGVVLLAILAVSAVIWLVEAAIAFVAAHVVMIGFLVACALALLAARHVRRRRAASPRGCEAAIVRRLAANPDLRIELRK